ncbi:MAG: ATP-binding protein [Anaerosomatales bacterium]|nr:ATP-binding protein [Anaerosomatales bacterium]
MTPTKHPNPSARLKPPSWLWAAVGAMVLATLAVGAFFLRAEGRQQHEEAEAEVAAVATNVATRISNDCERYRLSLELISSATPIRAAAARIALGAQTPADERLVQERLGALARVYGYGEVWLLDSQGRKLFAVHGTDPKSTPGLTEALREALSSGRIVMSDLHRPEPDAAPHVHFVAPLPAEDGEPANVAVVATVNADDLLYRELAEWPSTEKTGEALLLRRQLDGSVSISSPTRLTSDPPLTRSLTATANTVEVAAFHSPDSSLEGVDYRGERVIAYAKPVSGTPWTLLAKVDASEALAAWRSQEFLAMLALALVEASIVGSATFGWTRYAASQRKRDAERLTAVLGVLRARPASPHDLLVRLAREVMDATGSTACAVYRYHPDTDELSVDVRLSESIAQPGPSLTSSKQRIAADDAGAWSQPIRTGKPLFINGDAERVLAQMGYPQHHLKIETFMAVPVVIDEQPVAVVGLANQRAGYDNRDAAEVAMVFEAAWHEVERLAVLQELESRVEERTQELAEANEELQAQSEELAAANEELIATNEELNAANAELARQAEELAEQASELEQRTRELSEANEAKTKFLRTMSHELRTPLNSVIGFTQLMLQGLAGPLTEEQRKQLEMVNASGHHLLSLVNDLLDLSRIEAGAVVLQREPIDVAALVAEALGAVRATADTKGLALEAEVPEPAPPLVSDCTRVKQILLNLLSNAVKFTESGTVRIAVSQDGHRTVSFAVSDTGPGIPKEDLERIFDEFVQLDAAEGVRGTGLGLPIARRLAVALGGTLTAKSTVGRGSTLVLTLPQE